MFKIYHSADAICMGSATGDVGDIAPSLLGPGGTGGEWKWSSWRLICASTADNLSRSSYFVQYKWLNFNCPDSRRDQPSYWCLISCFSSHTVTGVFLSCWIVCDMLNHVDIKHVGLNCYIVLLFEFNCMQMNINSQQSLQNTNKNSHQTETLKSWI